jgi:N-acetylmuramoyl-L-alanine amidase
MRQPIASRLVTLASVLCCIVLSHPGRAGGDTGAPAQGTSATSPADDSARSGGVASVALTGLRSWSAPTNTRIVFDFSAPVTLVAPDSGTTRRLVLAIPGETIARAATVPALLRVGDGVVDSVIVGSGADDGRFVFVFADTTRFRVFCLPREDDKPFRVVVDVEKPGGGAAQDARLAGLAATKRQQRVRLVAIDPGHGGDDTGARGPRGILEKSVNLGVGRALVDALNEVPGIRAALTRDGDYFIPLHERYHIAERMKADLFISIHANSSRRRGSGSGTEVYFLSLRGASDQATQDLAEGENAADLVGGVPAQAEDDLVTILYDVKRASALQQSQLLAETLLGHLGADRRLEQRGVKQAGFAVLKSVEFPSVLVETAFINNPVEARMLRDADFQRQIGKQLANGVKAYFDRAGVVVGEQH